MTAVEQHKNMIDELVAHATTMYGIPESEVREWFWKVLMWTYLAQKDALQESFLAVRDGIQHG